MNPLCRGSILKVTVLVARGSEAEPTSSGIAWPGAIMLIISHTIVLEVKPVMKQMTLLMVMIMVMSFVITLVVMLSVMLFLRLKESHTITDTTSTAAVVVAIATASEIETTLVAMTKPDITNLTMIPIVLIVVELITKPTMMTTVIVMVTMFVKP